MLILNKSAVISEKDDKTNIKLDFTVPQGVKALKVEYSYSPKEVENKALANKAVVASMKKYNVTFANPEAFYPVKNLITLSFDENGKYRGACHRQPNKQTVIIADKDSTPGIFNRPIEAGEWDVVLNVHFCGCEVKYNITIEGVEE